MLLFGTRKINQTRFRSDLWLSPRPSCGAYCGAPSDHQAGGGGGSFPLGRNLPSLGLQILCALPEN